MLHRNLIYISVLHFCRNFENKSSRIDPYRFSAFVVYISCTGFESLISDPDGGGKSHDNHLTERLNHINREDVLDCTIKTSAMNSVFLASVSINQRPAKSKHHIHKPHPYPRNDFAWMAENDQTTSIAECQLQTPIVFRNT